MKKSDKINKPENQEAELELAPAFLAGKEALEPEVIRWVARNIDNPDANAEDCPDPFAWTLLRQCRANPQFQFFFIEKLWGKLIPSRSQLDDGGDKDNFDGKPTAELIYKIQTFRKESEVEMAPAPVESKVPVESFDEFEPGEDS